MSQGPAEPSDLGAALGALPLFPLPQVALFPGAVLPLHVFEPRYKAMIRDCLGTDRPDQGRGRSRRAWTSPIARIAGVGLIVDHAELPEGRFNILVRGRARGRLEELPFVPPYRTAKATILPTEDSGVPERDVTALLANAQAFVSLVREGDRDFDFRMPRGAPPGFIADLCAHHLVIDADERQMILETLNLAERIQRVTEILALQRLTLGKKGHELN